MTDEKCHYYATTAFAWATDDDLWTALSKLKKTGGMSGTAKKGTEYAVYKVPGLNKETDYPIQFYAPQVEGAECIAEGKF